MDDRKKRLHITSEDWLCRFRSTIQSLELANCEHVLHNPHVLGMDPEDAERMKEYESQDMRNVTPPAVTPLFREPKQAEVSPEPVEETEA